MDEIYGGPLLAFRVLALHSRLQEERNLFRWFKLWREMKRTSRALRSYRKIEQINRGR